MARGACVKARRDIQRCGRPEENSRRIQQVQVHAGRRATDLTIDGRRAAASDAGNDIGNPRPTEEREAFAGADIERRKAVKNIRARGAANAGSDRVIWAGQSEAWAKGAVSGNLGVRDCGAEARCGKYCAQREPSRVFRWMPLATIHHLQSCTVLSVSRICEPIPYDAPIIDRYTAKRVGHFDGRRHPAVLSSMSDEGLDPGVAGMTGIDLSGD